MVAKQKTKIGHVVSDKMQKTVVVAVDRRKRHPVYKKDYRQTVNYKVHDEKGEAKTGDLVQIIECRPMSKEKRWRLGQVMTKQHVVAAQEA